MNHLFPWYMTGRTSFKNWMLVLGANSINLAVYTLIVVGIWKLVIG